MRDNSFPTFIVGGGVRCATGWIRECLSEHPDVYMHPKETHYYDQNYEKGMSWYTSFFENAGKKKIFGEKTASYLHNKEVAKRIYETIPQIKLVFCLRDPVDRMYSHYTMQASNDKYLNGIGFEAAIEKEKKFLEYGKYYEQLKPYISQIPFENILIKIYEEIQETPYQFMSDIYRFIDANQLYKAPSTNLRTKLGKLEHESWLWGKISTIMLHPRSPRFLRKIYTEIRPHEETNFNKEFYKRFSDYFNKDIRKLEKLLDRDLSLWPTSGYS